MAETTSKERFNDVGISGRFGKAWEIGEKRFGEGHFGEEEIEYLLFGLGVQQFGNSEFGSDNLRWGLYQKRHSNWKIVDGKRVFFGPVKYIREKFYQCKNRNSPGQQTQRNKFRDGMTAWSGLTEEQKKLYNKNAGKYHMHGVNLFLREWLNS